MCYSMMVPMMHLLGSSCKCNTLALLGMGCRDGQTKWHLSGEDGGVILAGLCAAPVSGRSAPFLTGRQARFVASGLGVVRMTVRIPLNQRGWFTTFAGHDVDSFTRQMKRLPAALRKSISVDFHPEVSRFGG